MQELQAMRSLGEFETGIERENAFRDVELAEHRRAKQIDARAFFQQKPSDRFVAHVTGTFQSRLKIPCPPVPASVQQRRFFLQQSFYRGQVAMPFDDEFLDQVPIQRLARSGRLGEEPRPSAT